MTPELTDSQVSEQQTCLFVLIYLWLVNSKNLATSHMNILQLLDSAPPSLATPRTPCCASAGGWPLCVAVVAAAACCCADIRRHCVPAHPACLPGWAPHPPGHQASKHVSGRTTQRKGVLLWVCLMCLASCILTRIQNNPLQFVAGDLQPTLPAPARVSVCICHLHIQLGDFGLAIPASNSSSSRQPRTPAGEVDMVGTYPYLPPEYKSSGTISVKGDVYALGVSLLQLATGRLERLHDLVPHVRQGLGEGRAEGLLDSHAGGPWDEAAGQRLLSLGLWAVTESAEARPSSQVLAQELAKLWVATDQTMKLQASWGVSASGGAAGGSQLAAGGGVVGGWQPQGLAATLSGSGKVASGSASVGGFWRFLTSGST